MNRRSLLLGAGAFGSGALGACAPRLQAPLTPPEGFAGPELTAGAFVMDDGARLPYLAWRPASRPRGAILALHGMNDHKMAFHLAGPWWASRGMAVYAYDQRGFGSAPGRGLWAGEGRMVQDLRTATELARARHPGVPLAIAGESMGGAVAVSAFASGDPPDADRLVLLAPAVWGWSSQAPLNRASLWLAARLMGGVALEPPDWAVRDIRASDNIEELRRMGRDPETIFATRFDTLSGLVDLMESATRGLGAVRAPTLLCYGDSDDIIAKGPMRRALERAGQRPGLRTAWYRGGHHLLVRDLGRARTLGDILAFVEDAQAPLPSGAPPVLPALIATSAQGI